MTRATVRIHQLSPSDTALKDGLLDLFCEAFNEPDTYGAARLGAGYTRRLLGCDTFIALAAIDRDRVVAGIAPAYELPKFEQERSEIYLYDLAVAASHRRQVIATALIEELVRIAAARGCWVVFEQAARSDEPAINLYTKLGRRQEVLHFDIRVPAR